MLHTISETDYYFETAVSEPPKLTTIRDTLGESIPPMALQILIEHLKNIADLLSIKMIFSAKKTNICLVFSASVLNSHDC